jgi:UDP-N-acetylglucosamine--N-acetylmuramyl-(pentapeptide) pyrophosphoryl-undecaprenol N-acetylglucosamine transferase
LIPYPFAVDDHQVGNARFLVDSGAACLILQRDLTPSGLAALLEDLLADRDRLLAMAEIARTCATPKAVTRIATDCLELACR